MASGSPSLCFLPSHTQNTDNQTCALGDFTLEALSDTTNLEDLRLFAPCRAMYQLITARQHKIVVGVSLPDRFGARLISLAIATDPHRSRASALTFSEALYNANDVFREIVARADAHPDESRSAIIPYSYDRRFHFDHYSLFLRDFQHGIPLVEMIRGSRHIIDPKLETQSENAGIEKKLRGQIAWILLECCRETIERTDSLLGTISATEFLNRMRNARVSDHITTRIAALIGNRDALATPYVQSSSRGFAKYVLQAANSRSDLDSRSVMTPSEKALPNKSRGISEHWNSGLLDPIFVA